MAQSVKYLPSSPESRSSDPQHPYENQGMGAGELEGGSAVKSVSCCCRDLSLVPRTYTAHA